MKCIYFITEQKFWRFWSSRSLKDHLTSEDVITGFWNCLGTFVLYTSYALYIDYISKPQQLEDHQELEPDGIEPHAEEITQSLGSANTEQNVKFTDTHPGYATMVEGGFDSIRDAAFNSDATLDEFFSRPLRIVTKEWGIGLALFEEFNPWTLYFQNLRVVNRISNYKLLRAKLHMKVTVNGNAFHYGRAIMSYNPLPNRDELTIDRTFIDADLVSATQRPHIYIDPTNSQGGEMCVPMFYYKNALDITSQDWQNLGECVLSSMNDLQHANGGADTVTINVFAWATDVKFAIPTQLEPGAIAPQAREIAPHADEYGTGVVSRPAGIVANIASKLAAIPTIGPFARATEIGARALGGMAQIFGYSRPVMLTKSQYKPHVKGDMAVCDLEDDCTKLSVSAKQELTLDPRTTGIGSTDELAINYIAGRQSYLAQFDWDVGTNVETLLWNCVVDPAIHRQQAAEYHLPAASFAVLPFQWWRGSMDFRFMVVCSKYHKGRLKIVYDPSGNTSGTAEYNTAYTTIIDISDTTDFTIKCGWGQATTYREHMLLTDAQSTQFNTTALTYNSSTTTRGNGTLAVYVVNELTVPNTTITNDISINVFVNMGEDFEVAGPTDENIKDLRLTSAAVLTSPQAMEVTPHAGESDISNEGDEQERMDSAPLGTTILNTAGETTSLTDYTNHVHFGENIRSMRQLCKRYNMHEVMYFDPAVVTGTNTDVVGSWVRPIMPYEPGYTATGVGTPPGLPLKTLIAANYYYANMTFVKYLSVAYGGWRGGMRWMFDASNCTNSGIGRPGVLTLGRNTSSSRPSQAVDAYTTSPHTNLTMVALLNDYETTEGFAGSFIQGSTVNPVLSAEVPYYSEYRFTPAKQRANFSAEQFNVPGYRLLYQGEVAPIDQIKSYVAVAEDFNCFFFLGAPIFYRETARPAT